MNVLINEVSMDVSGYEIREIDGEKLWIKPPRTYRDTETLFNTTGKICKGCGKFITWEDYKGQNSTADRKSVRCRECENKQKNSSRKKLKYKRDVIKEQQTVCTTIGLKQMDVRDYSKVQMFGEELWKIPKPKVNSTDTYFNTKGKVCKDCGAFIEWIGYTKAANCLGGYRVKCKLCINKGSKEWREDNKDHSLKYAKEWKSANSDRVKSTTKKYYDDNRDDILKTGKNWRDNNVDHLIEYRASPANYNPSYLPIGYDAISDDEGKLLVKCYKCGKYTQVSINALASLMCVQNGITDVGMSNLYCGDECKQSCAVYKTNIVDKAVKSHLNNQPFTMAPQTHNRPPVAQSFIRMVLDRDNHQCTMCGSTENLHVHHEIGATRCPIFAEDLDNCHTRCDKCHREIHKREGCTYHDYRLDAE